MRFPASRLLMLALLMLSLSTPPAAAEDWPQWRGPGRDGVWRESGVVEKFDKPELEPQWSVPVGAGYSGPTVADDRVFLTDRQLEPEPVERILCFDAKSGQQLWKHSYPVTYTIGYKAGPRACVTVDDDRIFALGAMGHLHCMDVGGVILWKRDLDKEFKLSAEQRMPIWGITAAPLIVDRLVIVQVGGADDACLVAFDKKSGDEVWRTGRDRASYSAPILLQRQGRGIVVCLTGESVLGVDPQEGKILWRSPFAPKNMPIGVATPVVDNDRIFVSSFYDGGLLLHLNPNGSAVERMWRRKGRTERETDALHCMISTPVLDGPQIFGVDSYGELRCLDADDGDRVWTDKTATRQARWSNIHIVRHGERYFLFNELGELLIAKMSRAGFQEISRTKIIEPTLYQLARRGGVCWAHPAYADRSIFIRNDKRLIRTSLEAE